jgi:hypothetical protein
LSNVECREIKPVLYVIKGEAEMVLVNSNSSRSFTV